MTTFVFLLVLFLYAQSQYQSYAGQMPTNYMSGGGGYGGGYGGGGGGYGYPPQDSALVNTNINNNVNTGTNQIQQANDGSTIAQQRMNYNAAIQNTADSELATCAAFVCVEFVDSTAYGTNTVNTYAGQNSQAYANQGSGAFANQVQQATYSYPQTFTAFNVYGGFPSGGAVGSAFPFYGASGTQQENAFAYGNSASNQATTVHNDYFNDNHAFTATGKKCSKYVCTHSTDSATTDQIGPNYNIKNAYASNANQYGPNFANTFTNKNTNANIQSFNGY